MRQHVPTSRKRCSLGGSKDLQNCPMREHSCLLLWWTDGTGNPTSSTTKRASRPRRASACSAASSAVLATSCSGVTYSIFIVGCSLRSSCVCASVFFSTLNNNEAFQGVSSFERAAFPSIQHKKCPNGHRAWSNHSKDGSGHARMHAYAGAVCWPHNEHSR